MKKVLKRYSLLIFTLLLCCFTKDVYAVRTEVVCEKHLPDVEMIIIPECVPIPITVDIVFENFDEFRDIEILRDDTLWRVDFPAPTKNGFIFKGWEYEGIKVSNSRDLQLEIIADTRRVVIFREVATPSGVKKIPEEHMFSYKSGYRVTTFNLSPIFELAEKKVILNNSTGSNKSFSSLVSGENVLVHQEGNYVYGGVYYDNTYTNRVTSLDWNNLNFISLYNGKYNGENDLFSGYADLNLYVKWNEAIYSLSYETNGGQALASETVNITKKNWTNLKTPIKEGYSFKGWYYDSNLTQKVNGSSTENINAQATYNNNLITGYNPVKLYAKWEKIDDSGSQESDNSGDDSGNLGDDSGNLGDDSGNSGDDSGNPGDDSNKPGDDSGNLGDDSGNSGDDSGNSGDDSGNPGDDSNKPGEDLGNSSAGSNKPNDDLGKTDNDDNIKNPNTGFFAYGLIISLLLMMAVIYFVRNKFNFRKIFKI